MAENNPKEGNGNQLNIELSEEVAEGVYSNLAILTHSNAEFIIDFIKMLPGTPKAKVKSRVIITPTHAKRLAKALAENIRKYESQHGPIKDSEPNMSPTMPMNFSGPTGMA